MEIPFDMVEGHVVFELEGRSVLLDTGSPSTYSRSGPVSLAGRPLPAQPMPDEVARLLDDHVNVHIDVILGMDTLSHRRVAIESSAKRLVLEGPGQTAGHLDGAIALPLRLALGLPVVEIEADRRYPVVFDTGAPLSYLEGRRVRPLGTGSDFYLGIGAFETRVDGGTGSRMPRNLDDKLLGVLVSLCMCDTLAVSEQLP